jgi:nicotinamidase-related amidase
MRGDYVKPALLVIDIQKAFFKRSPETAHSLNQAMPWINTAIDLFRRKQLPIICIQHINAEEGLIPGAEGFDLPEQLNILTTDPHIHKTYSNAFNKTSLQQMLQEQAADTVIVTGYCAEYCVLSTYRGAVDRDLTPIILRGAIASRNPSNIPFVENISELISYGALKKVLA